MEFELGVTWASRFYSLDSRISKEDLAQELLGAWASGSARTLYRVSRFRGCFDSAVDVLGSIWETP